MPTYTYKARNNKGELKESSINSDTLENAKVTLKQDGLWIVDIKQSSSKKTSSSSPSYTTSANPSSKKEEASSFETYMERFQRVSLKDMVVFSRQFASMIEAGVAMLRALSVLTEQTTNPKLKKILNQVKYDIEQGGTLSDALTKHSKVFDTLYISMVKAGEAGGVLDKVLNRLAGFMEARSRLTQQVRSAMTYPLVVTAIAVFVFYAMLTFVLPTFSGLFTSLGSDLPAYTRFLISISDFMRSWYMGLIIIGIGFIVWSLKKWYEKPEGKYALDLAMLNVPILGDIMKKVAVARFTRTFGTLTKSGVPIVSALDVVKDSSGNAVLAKAVELIQTKVQQGGTISGPLGESKIFPPMVTQMVAIGEETGQLENMLEKVADFYDTEVENAVETLTSLMEPIMIVVLGGLVGAIVIGMYLPIFTVISQIK